MADKQENTRCKVTSPLGEKALFLTSLAATERVSGLFQLECSFTSGDDELDFAKIVGQSITLELEMAKGEARFFNGRVARFSQGAADASGAVYHAQIVPWFWFLTRRADCRIFQGDSVTQILEKVFAGHKQIADFKLDIEGKYEAIPYCVQYRETDFNFASRLMEEWGIGYYFEHTEKAHKMVLFNAPSKIVACPGQPKASITTAGEAETPGNVFDWQVQREFRSGAYALTDYNFRDPALDLAIQKKTTQGIGGNEAFEIFEYPGDYQSLGDGGERAQLRMEAEECAAHAIRANSSCYGFTPGYKFDLAGHARASYNTTYLITEVHHTMSQTRGGGGRGASGDYHNSFACVPHAIPYRPPRVTPKPVIQGAQTAVVVGEEKKEIDLDDLGCVFVKFHWDRHTKGDATSSCRVRVSEAWAGKGWGSFFAPRLGQEVIVEFLEGDPDRPIVTGRVYNGSLTPPYKKDANQGGIKTRSTMKGEDKNFNELRFDDTKGKEEISIHAERNMGTSVEADESHSVGGKRSTTIEKDDVLTVTSGNRTIQVQKGTQSETVKGNTSLTVEAGSRTVSVSGGTYSASASDALVLDGKGKGVTINGEPKVYVEGKADVQIKGPKVGIGDQEITLSGTKIVLTAAGNSITIDSSGVTIFGTLVKIN